MRRKLVGLLAALAATTLLVGCAAAIGQELPAGIPSDQPEETITPTPLPPRGEQPTVPAEVLSHLSGRVEIRGTLTQLSSQPPSNYILSTSQGMISVILHSEYGTGPVLVIAAPEGFALPNGDNPAATFEALEELAEISGGSLQIVDIRAT